jgi:CRP/FNR family transcriptional regulator
MRTTDDYIADFPALGCLDGAARRVLREAAQLISVPAGTVVFQEGDACRNYLLVLEGSVRVQKVSEGGREIVLYRVDAGQSCVLTTSCLLTRGDYSAQGIAETDVRALALSHTAFQDLLARSAEFRQFVFSSYAVRLADLLMLIEEVAFGRIDMRLAQFLADRADKDGQIKGTHQELAVELGTAREVISRQLKDFERRGWVALYRGRIEIKEPSALRDLCRRDRTGCA